MAKGDTPEGADVDMEERGVSDPRSSEEPEFARIFDEPKQAEMQESRQVQSETRTLAEPPAQWKNEDILMPGITPPHDERHQPPERNPPTLRPHPNDAAIPVPKMRRLSEEDMSDGASSSNSMDNIESRKILIAILRGIDVTEIYSPERVLKVCKDYALIVGRSMDLTTGYDFTKTEDKKRAWKHIIEDQPYCVIGSPPCTMFSMLQELNLHKFRQDKDWMLRFEKAKAEAIAHIQFCCTVYKHQMGHQRHFIHEHPW